VSGPRPASLWARVTLIAVDLACVTFFLLGFTPHGVRFGPYRIDLDVYRIGGHAWLTGKDLYGHLPRTASGARLPFTYPPIAAVLLSPLSLVPMTAAVTVLTLGSIALAAVVLAVFLRRLAGSAFSWPWALAWLMPPALFLEPLRNNMAYGQVNVVLMAMVTLDCLVAEPRWPRGALVGLAAAVKLTPAAFVLFFLIRRDYRAAGVAASSFLIATGAGFALGWHDSVQYWTRIVFDVDRIGNPAYAPNQSIEAVMARAGLDMHSMAVTAVWLAASAAVVAVTCRGMRHALQSGDDCWALSLNALAALLISPISWSHQWVWIAPALLTLWFVGRRHHARLPVAGLLCGLAVFGAGPQWWFPHGGARELGWAPWEQVVGSSYVIFAVLVLAASAIWKLAPFEGPDRLPGRAEPEAAASARAG
jgi:alpha-1,2-mannosyltransferase